MEKFFSCHAQKQLENVDTDTGYWIHGPWDQYNQCHKTKPKPHSWNTIGISSCDWEANTRDVGASKNTLCLHSASNVSSIYQYFVWKCFLVFKGNFFSILAGKNVAPVCAVSTITFLCKQSV